MADELTLTAKVTSSGGSCTNEDREVGNRRGELLSQEAERKVSKAKVQKKGRG